jgi:uncharacterized protein (TIGR03790 family)
MANSVALGMLQPGELDARHLALVFNRNSQVSGELALFYAARRGISGDRLIGLDLPIVETLPRDQYEPRVAGPIREWLIRRHLTEEIACLVTFYDVPIRVGPQTVTPEMRSALARTQQEKDAALQEFRRLLIEMEGIASPTTTRSVTTATTTRAADRTDAVRREYVAALQGVLRRGSRLTGAAENMAAKQQLWACMERAEGVSGILTHVRPTGPATAPPGHVAPGEGSLGPKQLERLKGVIHEAQTRINVLLRAGPLAPERQEARRLIRRYAGLLGLLAHLDEDVLRLKGAETTASLDSELSTLWSPPAGLYRWRVNTLNARDRANKALREALDPVEWESPVMMVSRLDGPSPHVVRRIIEDSLLAEKAGLKGNVYIDSRGLRPGNRPGSYELYDQNLRDLAGLISARTKMPVALDDRPTLFEIGACPSTALYCGWYSVGRYRDSFTFVPGAVAFHIASNEAFSLRDPKQHYWCKELLAHGAAATLGPVAEPYLSAFPLPRDFFGLLLTGRYALVECYYFTNPYTSWMMLLVGDPLYRPFAANPQLKVEDVLPADVLPLDPIATSRPNGGQ